MINVSKYISLFFYLRLYNRPAKEAKKFTVLRRDFPKCICRSFNKTRWQNTCYMISEGPLKSPYFQRLENWKIRSTVVLERLEFLSLRMKRFFEKSLWDLVFFYTLC